MYTHVHFTYIRVRSSVIHSVYQEGWNFVPFKSWSVPRSRRPPGTYLSSTELGLLLAAQRPWPSLWKPTVSQKGQQRGLVTNRSLLWVRCCQTAEAMGWLVSSFLIRGPGRGQRLWLVQRLITHVARGEGDVSHFCGSVFACIWRWCCTFCLTASLFWWPCLVLVSYEFYVCRRIHCLAVMARLADGSQGCCWLYIFTKHLLLSFRHSHNTISLKPYNPVRDNDLHFIGKKTKRWVSFQIHPLKDEHTQMFLEWLMRIFVVLCNKRNQHSGPRVSEGSHQRLGWKRNLISSHLFP